MQSQPNALQRSPTGLLTGELLPTKSNAETLGKHIASDCRAGFADTLETITRLRAVMLACETALADLEPDVINEVAKYGKEGAQILGARIEPMEGGVKYSYKNDPIWMRFKEAEDKEAEKRKDREKLLKALSHPIHEADPETGEMFEITPPIKTSKTTYKVTLDNTAI